MSAPKHSIDLGLAIMRATRPGIPATFAEMAAYCDVRPQTIHCLYQKAARKLAARLRDRYGNSFITALQNLTNKE